MNSQAAWETIRKHSKQLSTSNKFTLSPSGKNSGAKGIKFNRFADADAPIIMNLDGHELVFQNHTWQLDGAEEDQAKPSGSITQLRKENTNLQKENQLLKFKLELLIDMLSTTKLDLVNAELELKSYKTKSQILGSNYMNMHNQQLGQGCYILRIGEHAIVKDKSIQAVQDTSNVVVFRVPGGGNEHLQSMPVQQFLEKVPNAQFMISSFYMRLSMSGSAVRLSLPSVKSYPEMLSHSLWQYADEDQYENALAVQELLLRNQAQLIEQNNIIGDIQVAVNYVPSIRWVRRIVVDYLNNRIETRLVARTLSVLKLLAQTCGIKAFSAMWSLRLQPEDFGIVNDDDDYGEDRYGAEYTINVKSKLNQLDLLPDKLGPFMEYLMQDDSKLQDDRALQLLSVIFDTFYAYVCGVNQCSDDNDGNPALIGELNQLANSSTLNGIITRLLGMNRQDVALSVIQPFTALAFDGKYNLSLLVRTLSNILAHSGDDAVMFLAMFPVDMTLLKTQILNKIIHRYTLLFAHPKKIQMTSLPAGSNDLFEQLKHYWLMLELKPMDSKVSPAQLYSIAMYCLCVKMLIKCYLTADAAGGSPLAWMSMMDQSRAIEELTEAKDSFCIKLLSQLESESTQSSSFELCLETVKNLLQTPLVA
ncbi:hypothetical protein MIR68_011277 [Amoeboaphelidium protococcarum]|nr:hypothetical protein MIR68_011277 [Amoeboaphelidium protococcarum]